MAKARSFAARYAAFKRPRDGVEANAPTIFCFIVAKIFSCVTSLWRRVHSIRVIQSSFVKMEGLDIHNRVNHNNDGFHFINCEYVHISNCDVICQDDACALFGSCRFVTLSNCTFNTRWSVFPYGGGVAENITVSDCLTTQTFGSPIKMCCGPGSRVENMIFSNLVMNNVTGPIRN